MASSMILRSTLPRTFASATGRNSLRSALQGRTLFLIRGSSLPAFESESGKLDYAVCTRRTYGLGTLFDTRKTHSCSTAILKGTVNDPTEFPPPSRTHGSYHWAFERVLAASLVPMTAAAFVTSGSSYPVFDGLLGLSLVMHSHIGFDSMIVDYVHKRKFPVLSPILTWTLRSATVGVLVGVYQFNTNDIGLTELIAKVWTA
ncbi:mitochondrial inner membrane protein [Suillus subalutaceus]|uniref:mitochondrial inner membrane protein n=1 Tax=Suillus subalutaceus TaxID=48586 RepID=UPI001B8640A0|nr:mitochondrial inner membrane protein [Suillus subalutaceus]KAG1842895.1 mitochondrial inner membrane protein [Suillus subalutaceus]